MLLLDISHYFAYVLVSIKQAQPPVLVSIFKTTMASSQSTKLHFILFPLMAQGHMIPIIDIAKLLAERGPLVTIISTPLNVVRFKPIITRATESGLDIRLVELQFGCKEAGLPEGCENFDMLPTLTMGPNMFSAISNLQPQLEQYLEDVQPRPSCIISDQLLNCTVEAARKFGIPRIVFHGPGCFPLLCSHNILVSKVLDNVTSTTEPIVVPGMPDRIEFKRAQVTGSIDPNNRDSGDFLGKALEAEKEAYGIIVNTFEEFEPEYVSEYKKLKANKVYFIGPVSLCNKVYLDKAQRGNKTSIDENQCLKWLDSWQPSSVVYACLGSLNTLIPSQMMELGFGLELSNKPFIWAIRDTDDSKELKRVILEDGFEERVKGRGFIIWGWAPQVLILSHPSIGGFLTHCGWNSTLEGVSAGIPLITWPLFADQFFNEKLVVQVLGIGVGVGSEVSMLWVKEENIGVLVRKEDVENAINKVMEGGEEGEERRGKARRLGEMAKRAMEEGGSSYLNLTLLIEDIMQQARRSEST